MSGGSKAKIHIFEGISELLTLSGVAEKSGRNIQESDLGIVKKAAIVVQNGQILWLGSAQKIPKAMKKNSVRINLGGVNVLPGLIECHTHSVFAGNRAQEFELRNQGMSYQEIARKGGGILSTMRATRKASAVELLKLTQKRADSFCRQGVTTLEIKSGYCLNEIDELKSLAVAKKVKGPKVETTFLGPHACPPEFSSSSEYIDFVIQKVLPKIKKKKLARRVDIFIENGFFSVSDGDRYLAAARSLGFDCTIHADQLSLSGGAELALKYQALSADHLIMIENPQIEALAKSEITCVLLPLADLYMKCSYPPARKLLDLGARVALSTDFNPGSSPSQDVSLTGLLARLEMKMKLPEVIAGFTYNAACALGLQKRRGSLAPGKDADFFSTTVEWEELFYSAGAMGCEQVYVSGVPQI